MSLVKEKVSTRAGEVEIALLTCDCCGQVDVPEDSYYTNDGWMRLERRKIDDDKKHWAARTRVTFDFCSGDCVIRWLAPDIYDTDPQVVAQAIERLKRTERDLAGR